jgi:hypothetical protein
MLLLGGAIVGITAVALAVALLAVIGEFTTGGGCDGTALAPSNGILLAPPGSGQLVGATEYGGPADSVSGTVGSSGQSLVAHPDSYAELGGYTFQTATAMGAANSDQP